MDIKQWIKAARKHANITGEQLGDALGRTKGNVSAWEGGGHEPSFSQLVAIARHTKYPMDELIPADVMRGAIRTDAGAELAAIVEAMRSDEDRQALLRVARSMQPQPTPRESGEGNHGMGMTRRVHPAAA